MRFPIRLAVVVLGILLLSVGVVWARGEQEEPDPVDPEEFPGYAEADVNWRALEGESINILVTPAHYFDKMRAVTPEFTRLTGIEVTFDVVPPREMRERAILDLSTGRGEYASHTGDPMFLPLFVANNWIEPLDQYLDDPELTDAGWFNVDDIIPLWRGHNTIDGQLYGMPVEGEATILIYRKDLYDELGLEVPETLEQLRENAEALHRYEPELSGLALRGFRGAGQNMYIWPSLFLAFGGEWFDDAGELAVDSPEGFAALEYYVDVLTSFAPEGVVNWNWPEIMEAFAGGTVAQFIDANSTASTIENPAMSEVAGKVGYARWPEGPGGRRVTSIWNWAMPINAALSESEKHATWLYLQWVASRETQMRSATYLEDEGDIYRTGVNRLSIWEDPEYQDALGFPDEYFDVVLGSIREDTDADWRPRIPEWPDLGEELAIAVQNALVGEDAERALRRAADRIRAEILVD